MNHNVCLSVRPKTKSEFWNVRIFGKCRLLLQFLLRFVFPLHLGSFKEKAFKRRGKKGRKKRIRKKTGKKEGKKGSTRGKGGKREDKTMKTNGGEMHFFVIFGKAF